MVKESVHRKDIFQWKDSPKLNGIEAFSNLMDTKIFKINFPAIYRIKESVYRKKHFTITVFSNIERNWAISNLKDTKIFKIIFPANERGLKSLCTEKTFFITLNIKRNWAELSILFCTNMNIFSNLNQTQRFKIILPGNNMLKGTVRRI